jgi:hypothetical protein
MSTFWMLYTIAGLTTVIMSYFVLLQPILGTIRTVYLELVGNSDPKSQKMKHNELMVLNSKILVSLIFIILVSIAYPFILPALIFEDKKELFIRKFVEGALGHDD